MRVTILSFVITQLLFIYVKNPILHSMDKHIEIKHHFIRDYVQKGILSLKFIDTDH